MRVFLLSIAVLSLCIPVTCCLAFNRLVSPLQGQFIASLVASGGYMFCELKRATRSEITTCFLLLSDNLSCFISKP